MNEFHGDEPEIEAEYQARMEAYEEECQARREEAELQSRREEAELQARREEAEHANADDTRGVKHEVD